MSSSTPTSPQPRTRRRSAGSSRTLATLLTTAVERDPDGIAVVSGEVSLRYRELDEQSTRLARTLLSRGAGPESTVAIVLPRSIESIIAVWAVAKTGAAFVPIDASYPPHRINYQLSDCDALMGLTDQSTLGELSVDIPWLVLDDSAVMAEVAAESTAGVSYQDRPARLGVSNIAYVIYTSGSTGTPKGVEVSHTGLAELCAELTERYSVTADARTLHFASPSFDASILELLLAVGAGATLVITPPSILGGNELARLIAAEGVTHAFLTPSVLASIDPAGLDTLRVVVVGGEACPASLVREWASADRRFYNAYGPTETTVAVTMSAALTPDEPVSIGSAIGSTRCYVLDSRLRLVGDGVVGELYVSGPSVARGYHERRALTAQRFVPDPYSGAGARMYRTGDLVRRTPSGGLEYLGRIDDQIQVRGARIELGEIDATVARLDGVRTAVTIDFRSGSGETILAVFVQPEQGHTLETSRLSEALNELLPRHLLPNAIHIVDAIPTTPSGKADRAALRADATAASGYRAPSGVGEDLVADAFARVLGRRLGAETDFFTAGGNSLLATQVTALLSDVWGTRIPPRLLFDHATVATLAKALRTQVFDVPRPPLRASERPERLPLSPAQLRFWLRNQFDTDSAVDNLGFALALSGDLDVPALRAAFTDVVARHESLRTRYPADVTGPFQQVLDPDAGSLELLVTDIAADASSTQVAERVQQLLWRGFDVASEIPVRVVLLRADDGYVLVCAMHHICADGSSLAPLAHDITAAYAARCAGTAPAWRPLPVQYADYALWHQDLLGSRDDPDSLLARQLAYWTQELDGLPEGLDLPMDRPRPAVASLNGSALQRVADADLHRGLITVARQHRATVFMVMRTALAVMLGRLSGTTDIAIGVPMTNRAEPALDDVVGMFVNTTVSRTRIDPGERFTTLLDRTRERDLVNFAHSDVPFEQVVDAVGPVRSPGRHPLYQVGFAFQNFAEAELDLSDVQFSAFEVDTRTSKTDLHIAVVDSRKADGSPGPIAIRFTYATDLFDESTVRRFLDTYLHLLHQIASGSDAPVGDLGMIGPADRMSLYEWSSGDERHIGARSLTAPIWQRTRETPHAVAVVCGTESVTYQELHDRTHRMARWLIEQGIGPEDVVAVAMRRSIHQVVAFCAIVEAGAAWAPIDPGHPAERIEYVLDSASPHCVLTTSADGFAVRGAKEVHAVDGLNLSSMSAAPISDSERVARTHGEQPAYVIYTSGSTGRPKGVVISHNAIVNQLAWMTDRYDIDRTDIYLQKTPATFDVSLWGYFLPLWAGAKLVLAGPEEHRDPAALCRLIALHRCTLTDFVPSMLSVFAIHADPAELATLRAVFVIGEALPPETARAFGTCCRAELHNLYGPTEAAVSITEHQLTSADLVGAQVPIGIPQWNSRVRVLDARLRPVPVGVTGELYLAGTQLARGYHAAAQLTAERFVADPLGEPGERIYRTGDLVRWNSHGLLEYLGRTDFQVKLRGQRIELGDIETALLADPSVGQAVVTVRPSDAGDRLIGYVVAAPGADIDATSLRSEAAKRLPMYMVPAAVVVLDSLPTNSSGKLDRAALPKPVLTATARVSPRTPLEEQIADVFGEVLGLDALGVDDDFYELGGSSLLAFTLHQRLSARIDGRIPMSALLSTPTVSGLAALLEGSGEPTRIPTHALDSVLDDDIDAAGRTAVGTGPAHTILLTGATGYLGAHLLRELLDRTVATVQCLVRARTSEEATARIRSALLRYRLWDPALADRIVAVPGDLAAPFLGLAEPEFDRLAAEVDVIYHNGARVNHVEPYGRLRSANVEGTRWILRLAATRRVKPTHFISTISTAVSATHPSDVIDETIRLGADELPDSGYITSKWAAEELVRQAIARGVPATIYRPSTVCGSAGNGINNDADSLWSLVRAAAVLRMAPDVADSTVSLAPVDYVVGAIVAISMRGPSEPVYHLVNKTPVALGDIFDSLRDHGLSISTAPLPKVLEALDRESRFRAATGDDSLVRAALLQSSSLGPTRHLDYADDNTLAALAGAGIRCTTVDRTVIDTFVEEFIASGYLPDRVETLA
ncbi:amino acid adenylation domain-containing protein [Nocardia cyriacigeorgica]|uniref:Amino acid adenylation domain-containing protein n=1 Tax=Nocardia cyriacigeorgica TaxID=135487 RepID=A0A6P1D643_9NOCA|nr:amino acid adenylation domain-containing protein [Nocardia cyriacigeorgica]NEW50948.1 amino acid adenylation domain-containing protein [Nocardia cyriacigeorgica]NEW55688.1 amino acid adenylation domain-containing protein [Nocardia cyriacigeorgica]